MCGREFDEPSVSEELYAITIGKILLDYTKQYSVHELARKMDSVAVRLILEIQEILNDKELEDPECFARIDAIVTAFQQAGVSTCRHIELE